MNNKLVLGLIILLGGYVFYSASKPKKADSKKKLLIDKLSSMTSNQSEIEKFINVLNIAYQDEIDTIYEYVFSYILKGRKDIPGSTILSRMDSISKKYDIFT